MRPRAGALWAFTLLACSHRSGNLTPSDAGAEEPESALHALALERAVCMSRADCHLEGMVHTGGAADGDQLIVATVKRPPDAGKPGCEPEETWLAKSGHGAVRRVQLLASHCLSPSVAHATVTVVRTNVIRYTASDEGRQDREDFIANALDISLDPVEVLRKEVRAWGVESNEACNGHHEYWDWTNFSGEDQLFSTRGDRCSGARSKIIPHVELPNADEFLSTTWKRTALGDCSMRAVGASSGLRILAAGKGELFVEITDDHFVSSGVASDRLVIEWPDDMEGPQKLRIGLDGHSERGFDVRTQVVDATTRRYRIEMYASTLRVTYEDSDDGKTIRERVSSASEEGFSLVRWIGLGSVRCTAEHETLQVERKPPVMLPTESLYDD